MAKRPKLIISEEYIVRNGNRVRVDPMKTDLPDRFKLILAEMTTGQKYEFSEHEIAATSPE